jgi:effector-binding domain-containing protein
MRASVGDELIVHGAHLGEPGRDGEILEVRGEGGGPPYVVRWSDTGHETLYFPGSDATVHHFEHDALPGPYEVQTVTLQAQPVAALSAQVSQDGIADFLGMAFAKVAAAIAAAGLAPSGAPFGRYRPTSAGFDVEAGFPVPRPLGGSEVQDDELPGGATARTMHVGSYGEVDKAYHALESWAVDNGYVLAGQPWECYLDGPEVASPRTMVYLPIAEPVTPQG